MGLVQIASLPDPSLAALAVIELENAGIEATVRDGWSCHAPVSGIWVREDDQDRAQELVLAFLGKHGRGLIEVYWPYFRWVLVWPSVAFAFLAARFVVATLHPEAAASGSLVFLLAGPLAGSLAAWLSAPRFKWPLEITVLALGLRVSWSM